MSVGRAHAGTSSVIMFVLSGGGSLGALQAGMLEALLEAGVVPDAVIGTSIGAANAAFIAAEPSLQRARRLSELWRSVGKRDVFPVGPIRTTRMLWKKGSLFDPAPLRRLIHQHVPYRLIEDAAIPLRVVATDFADGSEEVFAKGSISDAVLASTALPGVFPPHKVGGRLYLDGGLVDHVPIRPALELGAEKIYILSCGFPCPPKADHRSARSVLAHSIGLLLSQRIRTDSLAIPDQHPNLTLVSIPPVCTHAGLRDLTRADDLIKAARDQTRRFLDGEPCHHCDHGMGAIGGSASSEGVMPLSSDIHVA